MTSEEKTALVSDYLKQQLETISFVKNNNKNYSFYVNCKSALGNSLVVLTEFCKLAPNGKDPKIRGLNIYKGVQKSTFCSLKVIVTQETCPELKELCLSVLNTWKKKHDPISENLWYQNTFNLGDGIRVQNAVEGIRNYNTFNEFVVDGNKDYDTPGRTYGNFLFKEDNDSAWFLSATVPATGEGGSLVLVDENGQKIRTKQGVYTSGGIPLDDHEMVRKLIESSFFQESQWRCKTLLRLVSFDWVKERDRARGYDVLFPVFKFKISGGILMKRHIPEKIEGALTQQERENILTSLVFKDYEMPSKRRKISKKKGDTTQPEYETEVINESDIEGEEE